MPCSCVAGFENLSQWLAKRTRGAELLLEFVVPGFISLEGFCLTQKVD
jgi:hypothetical protein